MTATSPRRRRANAPPAVFKQPTAYPDDMTMRCERARRGGAKSKQHTPTARTGRNDTTPCGHENTIPRRKHRHQSLNAPRSPYRTSGARNDEMTTLTAYGMTTRQKQARYTGGQRMAGGWRVRRADPMAIATRRESDETTQPDRRKGRPNRTDRKTASRKNRPATRVDKRGEGRGD